MGKLKLSLDDLRVQSFNMTPEPLRQYCRDRVWIPDPPNGCVDTCYLCDQTSDEDGTCGGGSGGCGITVGITCDGVICLVDLLTRYSRA